MLFSAEEHLFMHATSTCCLDVNRRESITKEEKEYTLIYLD